MALNEFNYLKDQARWDFEKARNKALFSDIINKLFQKNNALLQFDEVKYLLAPHGMVYRGVQTIPIDKIVGSEGRYEDFDKNFMPKQEHTRSRWENVDVLRLKEVSLPPISVYKIGNFYFVRDGNHRVSVARELKQDFIDAEIVELFTKVKLEEINEKELLLAEGRRYFLERTRLDELIPNADIRLTNPWGYYRLIEHALTYSHFMGEMEHREIEWGEAVRRWYYDLYTTVVKAIRRHKILKRFPGRTPGDLYIWVMDHWHFLKEKYGKINMEDALKDYSHRFGAGFFRRTWDKIKKWFENWLTGSKSE